MKKVEAFIRHEKVSEVRDALSAAGIEGMSFSEIKGCGRQKGYTETYRGARVTIHLRPKIKVEAVVEDDYVERVVQAIADAARTGEIGDGKIFVSPVEQVMRIRTRETGAAVL
ncbi:MAG: P-II family nitrogen regulator [Thermoleophilia bacterium]|nr:P-II family nitrogen regulator [Thermoleophilia bacterium]